MTSSSLFHTYRIKGSQNIEIDPESPITFYNMKNIPEYPFPSIPEVIDESDVYSLWSMKLLIDKYYTLDGEDNSSLYRNIRDRYILKFSQLPRMKEVQELDYKTNASYKIIPILDHYLPKSSRPVDLLWGIAEAPGASIYASLKLNYAKEAKGISLRDEGGLEWSEKLNDLPMEIVWGSKDDGNIISLENIDSLDSESADVVIADGGFSTWELNESNEHKNKLITFQQDLISLPLIISEILTALKLLKRDGLAVIKIFDTHSSTLLSLIYLLKQVFETVDVVKPNVSRMSNSEKYLVLQNVSNDKNKRNLVELLRRSVAGFQDDTELFPVFHEIEMNISDETFLKSYSDMDDDVTKRQLDLLTRIAKETKYQLEM